LAQRAHFSFLLNGWNEIAEVHSVSAITSLAELERDFPAAGIIVATRTHYISPPLAGAIRAKLLRITRQQRADYLRETLGDRAEELRAHLVGNRVLDELTRTPLVLAEVVTIFQSGNPVPSTRIGVLGAVMKLIETAPAHRPHLQLPPLSDCAARYLTHFASEMTARGAVLIFAADARAAMRSASATLLAENQVSMTRDDPDAVLHALTAHHALEQIDHPSVAYRFQHQQFQEFYAARFLADALTALVAKQDSAADKAFAALYIDKPMWEEPLRMVAEEIALAIEEGNATRAARDEGARLVRLALPIDPILAADLARLVGAALWTEVRDEISIVLRHWYTIGDAHHKQLALAAMMATCTSDFADVLVPLLTDADQQVRAETYHAFDTFYPTTLGTDWRRLVDTWHEDARADFVSQVTHRGRMADVGESFASLDPSAKVRQQAIQGLCWISASDVLERIVNGLDDTSLDAMFSAFYPEVLPRSVRPRFVAANRRLIGGESIPLKRIQFWLTGIEYGDEAIAPELMRELAAMSPPFDQNAGHAIAAALKVVKTHDPAWVNDWMTAKLLDGSLWGEHWKSFLQPVRQEKGSDLVRALAARELSYSEIAGIRLVLSTGATPELAQQIFDQLCNLQRSITAGGAQPLAGTCFGQLREAIRSFPIDIGATGMMRLLQGEFDIEKFKVVADVLGRVNPDADELRSMLPAALRDLLRRYLKDGISEVLVRDLLDDGTRSEAAIALGRIGDPEDLVDLEKMIEADIGRANGKLARTSYANWYRFAVTWLDAPNADATFIALLRDENYMLEAARGLFELAMPLRRRGITMDFEEIWKARGGMRPQGFDAKRAKRYAEAIKERIAELKQEAAASGAPRYATGRAKELAVLLAALDGGDSGDVVIEALSLPGERDAYPRMNGIRALLLSGASLDLGQMLAVLDPAIEHAVSQGLRDESLSLLFWCLELLPFSADPVGALARIEEVVAKFKYRPYQVRDLITALGHTRSEASAPFLISVARGKDGVQNMADVWIRSMGRLNTESARRALLSFVDPDIPSVGVSINFDYHNAEIYAAIVSEWARQDSRLRSRLIALCQGDLSITQQTLLRATYHELGGDDAMTAGVNLLQGSLFPWGRDRGLEAQFLESQPYDRSSGSFVLVPRNAEQARAELFQIVLNDAERRKAAFAILGQVELWRLEYRRPLNEPRHPMFETGEPWPPLSLFPKG
jgi:hypothetical protein